MGFGIPVNERIVVRPIEASQKLESGLYIPDTAVEKPLQGEVVAIGRGRVSLGGTITRLVIDKGDIVLFGKYAGTEVNLHGENLLILREDDVLLILDKEDGGTS